MELVRQTDELDEIDIERLVELVKAGDDDASSHLYSRTVPLIRHVAYRYGISANDVDDIVHDVYEKVLTRIDGYTEGNFMAWISMVTRNSVYDTHRKKSRHLEQSYEFPEHDHDPSIGLVDTAQLAVDDNSAAQRMYEVVREFDGDDERWDRLRLDELIAATMQGYPDHEIAAMLDVSRTTCRTRLYRLRQRLAESGLTAAKLRAFANQ